MKFNHWLEKKKFEEEWEILRQEYLEAGMTQIAIEEMYQFDCETFNSRRRFEERTADVSQPDFVTYDEYFALDSAHWIENATDKAFYQTLANLKERDFEILSYFINGYKQQEIAEILGVSQQAVSKRIAELKKKLKNF